MSENNTAEKIAFYESEKRKADLKIKLHADGLTQAGFFRGVIQAYITNDQLFMEWFRGFRTNNSKIRSNLKNNKTKKLEREGEETLSKFGLSQTDVEAMFDLIEREYPEL